jgi:hypothetical protein
MERAEQDNTRKILDLMTKKFNVISTYEDKAPDVLKFEIGTVKRDIFSQIMESQIKADFEEDIAKIISRLDALETKVQDLERNKKQ